MGFLGPHAATSHWLAHGPLGDALKLIAAHTGLPLTVLAGALVALSVRLVRRASAVFLEIGMAVAALTAATRLGWISW